MLLVEITVTRLFSVAFFHHYSFFAVSLVMAGLAIGGIAVSRWNVRDSGEGSFASRMAALALLFSFGIVIAALQFGGGAVSDADLDLGSVALQAVIFLPGLVAAGAFLAAAFARRTEWIDRLYAADLAAAAAACLGAIWLMRVVQGTATLLIPAALAALAAALLSDRSAFKLLCWVTLAAALAGAGANVASGGSFLRLTDRPFHFEQWNEHSRIVLQEYHAPTEHRILIDRSAATPLRQVSQAQADGAEAILPDWRRSATYMAYQLGRDLDRVAVIGVGGGDDLIPPLQLGAASVDGYELNGIIIDLLANEYADFNALAARPELELIHSEARVGIKHSGRQYDLIQASLIDTWAATASGGFLLSENGLYTAEGWDVFLDALSSDGILTMTRWYVSSSPAETQRLVALAAEALSRRGIAEPADHVLLVGQEALGVAGVEDGIIGRATILVSKSPFRPGELQRFEDSVESEGFLALAAPGGTNDPVIGELLDHSTRDAAIAGSEFDISPPTDARPYFFLQLRPADVLGLGSQDYGPVTEITINGVRVLMVLAALAAVFAAIVLTLAGFSLPSLSASSGSRRTYRLMSLYFFGIGMGYILVQLGLHQRLILILGHPTLVLSVVLFWMLLGTGAGAYLSGRLFPDDKLHRAWFAISAGLAVLVVLFPRIDILEEINSGILRSLTAGALLAVVGLLLGFAFPVGVRIVGRTGEWAIQKMWAVNGAASIAAAALSALIGISLGSRAVISAGLAFYLITTLAGVVALRSPAATAARGE